MKARGFVFVLLLFVSWTAAAIPEIQHWRTENGARVYFVETHEIPMVDVRVVFDAGAARDGDRKGLAVLTNALLAEGAGGLDADAIARRFESIGASFGNDAARDMGLATLRTLAQPDVLESALDTFALVLGKPDFPQGAFARERNRILVGLRYQEQSLGDIAEKRFWKAVYGEHPYADPVLGTRESVSGLTEKDVRAFYERYYVGANAVVAIVGDLDRNRAEAVAAKVVSGLEKGAPADHLPPVDMLKEGVRIDRAYPSSQTHVLMGHPVLQRGDPDYFPLYVGNHILGGAGLVSRISKEVREKRGLSYSAYSYFHPMAVAGPYELGLQTGNQTAERAVEVLKATLAEFVRRGPTEEELVAAKKNITGSFPLSLDSNSDIVSYIAMIGFYRLPLDYLETFTRRVEAVSVEDIADAYGRRVHPDRMAVVTVGGEAR